MMMMMTSFLVLLLLSFVGVLPTQHPFAMVEASNFVSKSRGEAAQPPRVGTLCKLVSRQVLNADAVAHDPTHTTAEIQRLRFTVPSTFTVPVCCGHTSHDVTTTGLVHVHIKAPDVYNQTRRVQPYSAHLNYYRGYFDIIVKIYTTDGPPITPGVSQYLGTQVEIGEKVHIPEIRAMDWKSQSTDNAAFICFGVGITECYEPAKRLLRNGAEVRLLYASRTVEDRIYLDELHALLRQYPTRFRVRHCLSQSASETEHHDGPTRPGTERISYGRVNATIFREEFGSPWLDGGHVPEQYLFIGTSEMEQAVLGMIGQAQLYDLTTLRGHPNFMLILGPHGINSFWEPLSPLPTPSRPALPITTNDNEAVSPQTRDEAEHNAMEDEYYEEEHTADVEDEDYENYDEYPTTATETTREAQEVVHEKEKEEQEEDYDEL